MHIHAFLTCASCRCRRPGKLMSLLKITAPRAVCVCCHTYAWKKQLTLIILPTHPVNLDFVHVSPSSSSSPSPHNPHQHTYPTLTSPKLKLKLKKKTIPPYQPSTSPSNSPHSLLLPQHCRMYSTAMSLVLLSLWLLLLFLCCCWCWCADHAHHC